MTDKNELLQPISFTSVIIRINVKMSTMMSRVAICGLSGISVSRGGIWGSERNGWDRLPPRSYIKRGTCYHLTLSLISDALNTHAIASKEDKATLEHCRQVHRGCSYVCGLVEHESHHAGSLQRVPATNGECVRVCGGGSHLAMALALGQCHNNCQWYSGSHGNDGFLFSENHRGHGRACLSAPRPPVIYPLWLRYHGKPLGHSDRRQTGQSTRLMSQTGAKAGCHAKSHWQWPCWKVITASGVIILSY